MIKKETICKDRYSLYLTEKEFCQWVNSNLPNYCFLDGSYLGAEILLARGYPRVRDIVGQMFKYIIRDADLITGETEPKVYYFLMSLPKDIFIEGYRYAFYHYVVSCKDIYSLNMVAMIREKGLTRKDFKDDKWWSDYKTMLRISAATYRRRDLFDKLKGDYDGSEEWWQKFEDLIGDSYEGDLLHYMRSIYQLRLHC